MEGPSKEIKRQDCLDDSVMSYSLLPRFSSRKLHWLQFISKDWQRLILDRDFIKDKMKHKEPLSGFFFQEAYTLNAGEDVDRVSYISPEPTGVHTSVLDFLPERVVLLACCNGLVCCRSVLPSPKPQIYVCNPLNKQWTSFEWKACDRQASVALAFDPIEKPFVVGGSINYKAVVLSRARGKPGEPEFEFEMYSSETGSWTRSMEKCEGKADVYKNHGIYVNGMLFWLTNGERILMYDPEQQVSMVIRVPIPFADLDYSGEMCIGESGGKLCYVLLTSERLQLWMLENPYGSQWVLSVSVEDLEEYDFNFILTQNLRHPDTIRGDGLLDLLSFKDGVLFMRYFSEFCAFDFETRTRKRLCSCSQLGRYATIGPIVLPYLMSLVPI